jgi:hypothetical protein
MGTASYPDNKLEERTHTVSFTATDPDGDLALVKLSAVYGGTPAPDLSSVTGGTEEPLKEVIKPKPYSSSETLSFLFKYPRLSESKLEGNTFVLFKVFAKDSQGRESQRYYRSYILDDLPPMFLSWKVNSELVTTSSKDVEADKPVTLGVNVADDDSSTLEVTLTLSGPSASPVGPKTCSGTTCSLDTTSLPVGTWLLNVVVKDFLGQSVSETLQVNAKPTDPGKLCSNPLTLSAQSATLLTATFPAGTGYSCSGSVNGAWYLLPFDGPVHNLILTSNVPLRMLVQQKPATAECASSSTYTCKTSSSVQTFSSLDQSTRIFIEYKANASVQVTAAELGEGAICNPNSTTQICVQGACQLNNGEYRCAPSACDDGVNNDNDPLGLMDYPADPGCSSPEDLSEDDPAQAPVCADGVDEDSAADPDTLVDWTQDPGCGSASGMAEGGNGESCAAPLQLTASSSSSIALSASLTFTGAQDDERMNPFCSRTPRPDRVVSFRMPGLGSIAVWGDNQIAALSVRTACIREARDLACKEATAPFLNMGNVPGGNVYVVAEGSSTGTVNVSGALYEGSRCEPSQPWFSCVGGSNCVPEGDHHVCRRPRCRDGKNNDGAEDTLKDYPNDPGCSEPDDDDETNPVPLTECSNGIDDNGNQKADYVGAPTDPAYATREPSCLAAGDTSETHCGTLLDASPLPAQPIVVTGTTALGYDSLGTSCSNYYQPPDRVYDFIAPSKAMYRFSARGTSGQSVAIGIRDGSCQGAELACAVANPPNKLSVHWMMLEKDQRVVLVVETQETIGGPFELTIHQSSCNNGIDEDEDGVADWPFDPGCDSPYDGSELDPSSAPVCANGVNDDPLLDAQYDYSSPVPDSGCASASDSSEETQGCAGIAAVPVGSSTFPVFLRGETSGTGQIQAFCANLTAPEKVFHWKAPEPGKYLFKLSAASYTSAVLVPLPLSCSATVFMGCATLGNSIERELALGEEIMLVVDSYSDSIFYNSGSFEVEITKAPPPPSLQATPAHRESLP